MAAVTAAIVAIVARAAAVGDRAPVSPAATGPVELDGRLAAVAAMHHPETRAVK